MDASPGTMQVMPLSEVKEQPAVSSVAEAVTTLAVSGSMMQPAALTVSQRAGANDIIRFAADCGAPDTVDAEPLQMMTDWTCQAKRLQIMSEHNDPWNLSELVQRQGQMLLRMQAQLADLRRMHLNLAREIADFSRLSGYVHYYSAGRGASLSAAQRRGIARLETKLLTGEYQLAPHPCPCGAHDDRLLAVRDRYGISVNTVICRACGLIRLDPYYTPETLTGFYNHEYDDIYGRTERNFHAMFSGFYAGRGASFIRNLREHGFPLQQGRRIYEIGCGGGWNLKHFQELGCIVIGVDYDEAMIRLGRELGLDLRTGSFEQLRDEPRADLLILSHVLEHVPDLQEFLGQAMALLAPGGALYVCVPTLETMGNACNHNVITALQNAHVYYFSLPTLTAALERSGLSVTRLDGNCVLATPGAPVRPTDCRGEYARAMALLQREERIFFWKLHAGMSGSRS